MLAEWRSVTAKPALFPTSVSLVERRDGDRQVATYRAARIVLPRGQEQLGIIRNASAGGVMIETHAFLAVGDCLSIEPRGCAPIRGKVVWSDKLRHGIAFECRLAPESLLKVTTADARGPMARAPRVAVAMEARLRVAGTWTTVHLCDLSQGGAKIEYPTALAQAEPVALGIDGLGTMPAFIRWQREGKAGLLFAEPLSITALSAWIAGLTLDHAANDSGRPDDLLGPIENYV